MFLAGRIISHKMQIENAEDEFYLYLITDEGELSLYVGQGCYQPKFSAS